MKYEFIPVDGSTRKEALDLLAQSDLPISDLDESKPLFVLKENNEVIGTGGLEIFGTTALIRSVSIREDLRGKGIGKILNRKLEDKAISSGIQEVFLLTTTAKDFFQKENYQSVDRKEAPVAIQSSSEFKDVCPSSATLMKKKLSKRKVLFVCIENSNRSQMAQAFVNLLAGDFINAYSAGSRPSGVINPKAIKAMKELGYDLTKHESKSLDDVKSNAPFDIVVTMGCGDACPWMPAKKFIDWNIPDPRNMEGEEFNKIRDLVREHVEGLIATEL